MDELTNRKTTGANSGTAEPNRRRLGTIVHDDRGMASVEWHDAPVDHERPVLQVLADPELTLKDDDASYDPYARHATTLPRTGRGNTTRTDLRKLSEWIKMKRELEERKLRGTVDEDEDEKS